MEGLFKTERVRCIAPFPYLENNFASSGGANATNNESRTLVANISSIFYFNGSDYFNLRGENYWSRNDTTNIISLVNEDDLVVLDIGENSGIPLTVGSEQNVGGGVGIYVNPTDGFGDGGIDIVGRRTSTTTVNNARLRFGNVDSDINDWILVAPEKQ